MSEENNENNKQLKKRLFWEIVLIVIGVFLSSMVSHVKDFITLNNPDYYKALLSLLNLIVVGIFFQYSSKELKLEFAKDNHHDEKKRKDKSKRKYWKSLNISSKTEFQIEDRKITYLEQAEINEDKANLLVGQLYKHIQTYAAFLIVVYFTFLIDNETLFSKFGWRDFYNYLHPFFKIIEDISNLLSALFIYFGFKVLYFKTLSAGNKKIIYKRRAWGVVIIIILAYFLFTAAVEYPNRTYEAATIKNIEEIIKPDKLDEIKNSNKTEEQKTTESYEIRKTQLIKLKELSIDHNDNNQEKPLTIIEGIIKSAALSNIDKTIEEIGNEIIRYKRAQNPLVEIIASLFQLLIGVYNGLVMALLFGRYISMEERVREINKIKYKWLFTKLTIYILPIYALSQPLFGSFDMNAFGDPKWVANAIFLFCLVGKIFFLFFTYWFMKERLMHGYLHLILTSHGVPKDFYQCFNYPSGKLIENTTGEPAKHGLKTAENRKLEKVQDLSLTQLIQSREFKERRAYSAGEIESQIKEARESWE